MDNMDRRVAHALDLIIGLCLLILVALFFLALFRVNRLEKDIERLTHCQDVARDYIDSMATREELRQAVLATTKAEE